MATYKNTLCEDIMNLLKTNLGSSGFGSRFYYGNRPNIPKDQLPCLTIGTIQHNAASGATQTDFTHYVIEIRLVFDKRSEFDKAPNDVVLQKTLENLSFGRDNTTGEYSTSSIYGVLRKYLTISSRIVNSTVQTVIPDLSDPASTIGQAIITFEADERVVVQRTTT